MLLLMLSAISHFSLPSHFPPPSWCLPNTPYSTLLYSKGYGLGSRLQNYTPWINLDGTHRTEDELQELKMDSMEWWMDSIDYFRAVDAHFHALGGHFCELFLPTGRTLQQLPKALMGATKVILNRSAEI